tara:strand:- start:2797 stop:3369 length:573 start_codon:yes stop_codon:yes gene_type:complete
MNNILANPLGIDQRIQDIQTLLYEKVSSLWLGDIDGYGRIYRTPLNSGADTPEAYATSKIITPEWFNAETQEYESVYFNDNKSTTFCFLTSEVDSTDDEFNFLNNVKIVFMSNLDKIYSNVSQRQDSKQEVQAIQILRDISFGRFHVTGIERRVEKIFQEFSSKEAKFDNMNKNHIFSININLSYTIANN